MTIDYRAARELYITRRIIEAIEHDPRLAGRPVSVIIREARAQAIEEWGVLPPQPRWSIAKSVVNHYHDRLDEALARATTDQPRSEYD